jgi:hypothetical protein
LQADQLLRERSHPIDVSTGPTKVDPRVTTVSPTQTRKPLSECREASLLPGIAFVARHEHADAPHALALLRARRERPRGRAAKRSDEIAPSKANADLAPPSAQPKPAPFDRARSRARDGFITQPGLNVVMVFSVG